MFPVRHNFYSEFSSILRPLRILVRCAFSLAFAWFGVGLAGGQVSYFQSDFSSLPSGATLSGNASITSGVLQLVPAAASQSGSAVLTNPSGNVSVTVFDVSCDVYTGNAANASVPADGWSFAWGEVSGSFGEEGPSNFSGLVVSFDYFINGGAGETAREVTVNWNGSRVGRVEYDSYSAGASVPVHIRLRPGGLLDVWHNGTRLFSGLALPGFTGLTAPKWGFGARTGSATARVTVDNLVITPSPIIVTSTAGSGSGTLRQALSDALSTYPGPNQIHFSNTLNGQTLSLGGEQLTVGAQTVTMDASTLAAGITLSAGKATRLIVVEDAGKLLLNRVSLRDGKTGTSDPGSAVYFSGELEMIDSTITECQAEYISTIVMFQGKLKAQRCAFTKNSATDASVIWIQGTATVTFEQCTFQGNTNSSALGAIVALDGNVLLHHCTVVGNSSNGFGGGIRLQSPASVTIKHSVVAGNTAPESPDISMHSGTLITQGVNIIGAADVDIVSVFPAGLPNAQGNFVGSTTSRLDARLGSLGSYGGFTQTMRPLFDSPARDAATGSTMSSDQRSLSVAGTPDVGACEYRLSLIADQSMLEDGGPKQLSLGAGSETTLTATSSNTTLLPASGMALSGTGASRTLSLTPAANQFGSAVVTVTDTASGDSEGFTLTVTARNDAPSFSKGWDVVHRAGNNSPQTYAYWASAISPGPTDEATQTVQFLVTASSPALFSAQPAITPDGTLTFTPAAGATGGTTISVRLQDNGGTANSGSDTSPVETFAMRIGEDVPRFYSSFGAGLPSGTRVFGNGELTGGEVRLVPALPAQSGSLVLQNITGSVPVTVFDVSCSVFTGEASSPTAPADGWSFAVGEVPFSSFGEEGPANFTGLVVSFDYYVNAGEPGREVAVRWNGTQIGSVLYDAYADDYSKVHIRLRQGGLLDVWHKDNRLFSGLPLPGFTSLIAPRWGFGARTGGLSAEVTVDTLAINPQPLLVTSTQASGTGSLQSIMDMAGLENTASYLGPNQIHFDASLQGQTLSVPTGGVSIGKQTVAIDASTITGGVTLDGKYGGLILKATDAGGNVFLKRLTLTSGQDTVGTGGAGGAGLTVAGLMEMWDSTITQCQGNGPGGAIKFTGYCELSATNCTFRGNSATTGGAIYMEEGSTTLDRCTLSGNQAVGGTGGGLRAAGGAVSLKHCTVSGNTALGSGGGLSLAAGASLRLAHSIIAGNLAGSRRDLVLDSTNVTLAGPNLIGVEDSSFLPAGLPNSQGNFVGTASSPLDAKLSTLGSYGGPTQTMPLLSGSPARNAATGSTITSDQRGFGIHGVPDVGAYETGTHASYAVWAAENSTSASPLGSTADGDFDGLDNLAEYGFHSDPLQGDDPGIELSATEGELKFPYQPTATDLRYTVQRSTDLSLWETITELTLAAAGASQTGYAATLSAANAQVTLAVPDSGASREFWRVIISDDE